MGNRGRAEGPTPLKIDHDKDLEYCRSQEGKIMNRVSVGSGFLWEMKQPAPP